MLEKICGTLQISASQVSRAAASLDEELAKWRARRLDAEAYPSLALETRYEKVRLDGSILSCGSPVRRPPLVPSGTSAVLIAVGISATEKRAVLGVSDALS